MNIIRMGEVYRVFDNGIEVSRTLGAGTYEVGFSMQQGFFLNSVRMPDVGKMKVYGKMNERIEKVMRGFSIADKNLGVILSGEKGIGKSLFAKLVSIRAVAEGWPVILVNDYFNGLPQFLMSIEQKCVVLFDEFDKNFYNASKETEAPTAVQDAFLTLFDGVYASNKLFIITANDLKKLSEFLINRPGRFRYHIRFTYPDESEIREFLNDQVHEKVRRKEIEDVVKFSTIVPLSYDCLTAIAAELNMGESFADSLEILNILNVTGRNYYHGLIRFATGETLRIDYVGSYDFFEKTYDDSILSMTAVGYVGTRQNDFGRIVLRQGDVRRCGKFHQDGSIAIPYDRQKAFKWLPVKRGKSVTKSGSLGKPIELILLTNGGNQKVSYTEILKDNGGSDSK